TDNTDNGDRNLQLHGTPDPNLKPMEFPQDPVQITLGNQGITDTQLRDLIASGEIPANTHSLGISGNQITDISPLVELKELISLSIADNQVSDLSPLGELKNLGSLIASGNLITDLTPLSSLEKLMVLHVPNNQIADVTPLMAMSTLTSVNVFNNRLSAEQIEELKNALTDTTVIS
ncbi:MAG: leucine-rich repeat domain-containing protein, partial [Oscillospiraceae bacterium]|nr:leucine-rich repeat domain-containing protein [Oscillospiraceae bacterium]